MAGAQEDASKIDEKVRPFVMVHGTWGRGILFPGDHITRPDWWHLVPFLRRLAQPPWFSEGSQFRSTLQSELEKRNTRPDFHIFRWSGANSVFARDRAASELSKLIASQPHGSRTVVIAHSHGGNVAMRALNILGERAANIHLITLATPFLRIFPTWTGLHFGEVLLGVWFGMLILILSLASLLLHSFEPSNQFKEAVDAWLPYVIAIYLVVSLMLAGPIVYFFVNPRGASTLDRHKMPWLWRPFILAEATNFTA